jgi:superkiller protein 3
VYVSQGSWSEAIVSYQEATKINPRLINPWINLGSALMKKERYEEAIHAYQNALKLDPSIVKAWNELGNAYMKIKAYQEAVDAYEKVTTLNPNFGWPFSNLAYAYYKLGDYSQAVRLYKKSIGMLENDNAKANAWNHLGDTYRQLKDYKMALSAYQTADQLTNGKGNHKDRMDISSQCKGNGNGPGHCTEQSDNLQVMSTQKMGQPLNLQDDGMVSPEKPTSHASPIESAQSQSDDEECPCYWNNVGNVNFQKGCFDEAITAYKRAIELAPESIWPYLDNLTYAYFQKGKSDQNGSLMNHSHPKDLEADIEPFEENHESEETMHVPETIQANTIPVQAVG